MNARLKFQRLAKVLAPILSGKPVEVTIGGTQAYTTGKSINIPEGDFEDPDFVTMVHGYIDHELGHNSFTDFKVSSRARSECPVLNKFRNALEDVRMEYLQGQRWPGAKINLNKLATLCVVRGLFPPISQIKTPTKQVLFFCLYWGRLHINQQYAITPLADEADAHLRTQLGNELVDNIMLELKALKNASSNEDCLNIARAILKLIKDEVDDAMDDEDESKENSAAKHYAQSILDAPEDDDISDIHEIIEGELAGKAKEAEEDDRVTNLTGFSRQLTELANADPGLPLDVANAKAVGRRVYKTIRRALIDSSMNQRVIARSGKRIAKRRLASVKTGAQSVFERRFEKPEPTAAISFLVDASGSMKGDQQQLVGNSALAFAHGLSTAKIKTQFTFFGVDDPEQPRSCLYRAKRFEDKAVKSKSFSVVSDGTTPTGPAMQAEVLQMINRTEDIKLLFVLTDGTPNSPDSVESAIEAATLAGIRVIPIGIKAKRMKGFKNTPFTSIQDLSELDGVVKNAISNGLLK